MMKKRFVKVRGVLAGLCVLIMFAGFTGLAGCGNSSESARSYVTSNGSAQGASPSKSASYSSDTADLSYKDYAAEELWMEGEAYDTALNDSGSGGNINSQKLDQTSASKRKLIKTVNMNVETQEYDTLMGNLQDRVKELGGYVQNMDSHNGSAYNYSRSQRYANMTLRIPQQSLDEFIGSISDLANVVSRSESVNDVTLQYVDMQSHKESLQVEQKRLLELLEQADDLEDIITLEDRLTKVRYQIESMESSLRTFDDQVDYSTVYLRIDEVKIYTVVEEEEETVWERMTHGFMDSLEDVKDGFVNFGVWFVVNIPYLIIWAVVITVICLVLRRITKGKKGKGLKKSRKNKVGEGEEASAKASELPGDSTKATDLTGASAQKDAQE